jgi:hypothetical protein
MSFHKINPTFYIHNYNEYTAEDKINTSQLSFSYLLCIINSRPHHGSRLLKMKQTNYIDILDKGLRTETN